MGGYTMKYFDLEVKGVTQRMSWIEAGEFMMGSPETEEDRDNDEILHRVGLTEGFWLADTACSQAFYKAVMAENPSHFKGDDLPVERVSWHDVQTFLKKLNDLTQTGLFRLPTEAEWEYACRAGSESPFSFGKSINSEQVNFDGDYPYANSPKSDYRQKTIPVKSLPCNNWGLYEMHGNVWEWCSDWHALYDTTEGVAGDVVINPHGPDNGDLRVLRGGSWKDYAGLCRSAFRYHFGPDGRGGNLGFRFALEVTQ
jgi:formylglycine-generating enzyme required for sulfatase activity